jgi:hypothetical protein
MKYFIENYWSDERSALGIFKMLLLIVAVLLISSKLFSIQSTFFEYFTNELVSYKLLPHHFQTSYNDNLSDTKTQSLKILLNKKKSGLVTNLNELDHPKMIATFDIPSNMKVSNVTVYGLINQGTNNNDDPNNIKIRVLEKYVDNEEHNIIGTGIINMPIKVDVSDNGKNYLLIEVESLDTLITGGKIICSR